MEIKKNEEQTIPVHSDKGIGRGRSRKKGGAAAKRKKRPYAVIILAILLILIAGIGGGYYFSQVHLYREAFLPNTKINGIDASKKTVEEVKAAIEEELAGYELKVLGRNGYEEVIKKDEIGLHSEFDGSLEELMEAQDPMTWITAGNTSSEHEIGTMIVYDEAMLEERIAALSCMDPAQMTEPQDAFLSEYQSDTKSYQVIPAEEGTTLIEENVKKVIADAIMNLQNDVDLDAASCYTGPTVPTDDEKLQTLAAELNSYVGAVVNHTFGNVKEVLDGDTIHQWLAIRDDQVTLDESKVTVYVRSLAKKYNTAYGNRKVKTSYGKTVTIAGGPYGWRMNEAKEAAAVLEIIKNGEQQTREPEYLQKAASHGDYDYGNTYVEINLTAQHLFFYKNGKLVVETDFVSGNSSKGWSTPAGAYPLTYKERNATLNGEDYSTPVSYWMPFNGNIGLHDASWRAAFGGTIYKTNGSHGCVNLPPSAAKKIYENISAGDPVLCYHLGNTESSATSKPTATETAAPTTVAPTTAAPTTAEPTTVEPTTATPTTVTPTTVAPTTAAPTTTAPVVTETKPAGPSAGVISPETGNTSGPGTQPGPQAPAPQGPGSNSGGPGGPGAPGAAGSSVGPGGPGAPGN